MTTRRPAARPGRHAWLWLAVALTGLLPLELQASDDTPGGTASILANDNTHRAGSVEGDVVTIRLRAASGPWRPEGADGPALTVDAFGEEGRALTVPAPLIRVVEGARLHVSVRNELEAPLRVHGLCARDGGPCQPLDVPPGETRDVGFASGRAGTYHYWASSLGAPMPFRELAGALIVDPPGPVAPDRLIVITEWSTLTAEQLRQIFMADDASETFVALRPRITFVLNGLSWPATERLTYRRDETVRWRVLNLSSQTHPMHLHGFYFTVLRAGDGQRDEPIGDGLGQRVVTHIIPSGGTLLMEWTPEREGNWLFHCHIMHHVSPDRRLEPSAPPADPHASHATAHGSHAQHDASLGMAGMVMGITVLPPSDRAVAANPGPVREPRRQTMVIARETDRRDGISVAFTDDGTTGARSQRGISMGPALVLRRGEPVEITVVNRLDEPTSIHWHGLELESYYDGVHGWSGSGTRTAPMIAPGESFVVRITPPRAGTFIYHTHLHDYRQLSAGLYGPLIVTEPGETYDPALDHVVVLGRRDASEASSILQDAASVVLNGERAPRWLWRPGSRHRIRLVNITPDDILVVSLRADGTPLWRPLTKDGVPVPGAGATTAQGQASVRIAVGETYDFEYETPARGTVWLDVQTTSGKWQVQGQIVVK